MMKLNKNSGFSLAESVISLMLLTLTIMLTMSSITRKKHHQEKKVDNLISGMYACWVEGEKQFEWKCDGNVCKKLYEGTSPETGDVRKCIIKRDRRVGNYYYYVVGSRYCEKDSGIYKNCINGQTKFESLRDIRTADEDDMKLRIFLGNRGERSKKGDTYITEYKEASLGETADIYQDKIVGDTVNYKVKEQAIGGIEKTDSGLIQRNVEKCQLVSNNPCGDNFEPKCNNISNLLQIKCNSTQAESQDETKDLNIIRKEGNDTYKCSDSSSPHNIIKIKVKEKDSDLKASCEVGLSDGICQSTKNSQFIKQLRLIPTDRRNGLINKLYDFYQKDEKPKDGVVLIVW